MSLHDVAGGKNILSIRRGLGNTTMVCCRCRYRPLRTEQGWIAIGRAVSNRGIVAGAPPFGRVALIDPARDSLIENPEIAVSLGVQLFVGQTGQLVRTGSVEDD
jgi:hypothetical protein